MKFTTGAISFLAASSPFFSTMTQAKEQNLRAPVVPRQLQDQCVNLVANGSFEDHCPFSANTYRETGAGDPCIAHWTVGGTAVDIIGGNFWQAADGMASIDLNHDLQGSVSQTISTIPGKQYRLTFAMSGNPDRERENVKDLTVVHAGGMTASYTYDVAATGNTRSNMMYVEESLVFTADSTDTLIMFEGGADDNAWSVVIDDVRVCEIPDGGMSMDPHIKKWNGSFYDFQGECDLVLVSAPEFNEGQGLNVHVRTTIRYDYSYVESAALQLGGDILEVSSWGQVAFNGVFVDHSELEAILVGGFALSYTEQGEKHKSFVIHFNDSESITIRTFKDFVNVNFNVELPGSKGLMGDFSTATTFGRDGTTVIEDPNELGQEWQVLASEPMLFHTIRSPQAPAQKCILPSITTNESRRLGELTVTQKQAEAVCSMYYSGAKLENCVLDVMRTGDLEMADAPGAY